MIRFSSKPARVSRSKWSIRRCCHGAEEIDIRWELAPTGSVPGELQFDAIARARQVRAMGSLSGAF